VKKGKSRALTPSRSRSPSSPSKQEPRSPFLLFSSADVLSKQKNILLGEGFQDFDDLSFTNDMKKEQLKLIEESDPGEVIYSDEDFPVRLSMRDEKEELRKISKAP